LEATELIEMGREQFLFAVQETPLFAIELMASLERRLRGLED
jgi:CRP-like cAMP-binding protein